MNKKIMVLGIVSLVSLTTLAAYTPVQGKMQAAAPEYKNQMDNHEKHENHGQGHHKNHEKHDQHMRDDAASDMGDHAGHHGDAVNS